MPSTPVGCRGLRATGFVIRRSRRLCIDPNICASDPNIPARDPANFHHDGLLGIQVESAGVLRLLAFLRRVAAVEQSAHIRWWNRKTERGGAATVLVESGLADLAREEIPFVMGPLH